MTLYSILLFTTEENMPASVAIVLEKQTDKVEMLSLQENGLLHADGFGKVSPFKKTQSDSEDLLM